MHALLVPEINSLKRNILELKKLKRAMLHEQVKANKIKGKEKREQKDTTKLIGIRSVVGQHLADAEREASEAQQSLSAISGIMERERIRLKPSERRIIFGLKQERADTIATCKTIHADVYTDK